MDEVAWHYTLAQFAKPIISTDFVLKAKGKVGQLPAVWLSMNQHWDNTAATAVIGVKADGTQEPVDIAACFQRRGELFRFGVLAEQFPMTWAEYRAKVSEEVASHMETSAIELGADPAEWRVSIHDIPQNQWVAVEFWDGAKWTPLGKK